MSNPQTDPHIKAIGELFIQLSDEEQRIAKGLYQLLAACRAELSGLSVKKRLHGWIHGNVDENTRGERSGWLVRPATGRTYA